VILAAVSIANLFDTSCMATAYAMCYMHNSI